MPIDRRADRSSDLSAAQLRRDAMLARVARTRRGAIVGAGALSAALAALVSVVAPGRSSAGVKPTPSVTTTPRVAHTGPTMPPAASAGQLGLQPPGSAPQSPPPPSQQTQTQPQAAPAPVAPVSGGS